MLKGTMQKVQYSSINGAVPAQHGQDEVTDGLSTINTQKAQ